MDIALALQTMCLVLAPMSGVVHEPKASSSVLSDVSGHSEGRECDGVDRSEGFMDMAPASLSSWSHLKLDKVEIG